MSASFEAGARFRICERISYKPVNGAIVIVQFDSDRVLELNATASRIWELLAHDKSVAEIGADLRARYVASGDEIERDLHETIAQLLEQRLIEHG